MKARPVKYNFVPVYESSQNGIYIKMYASYYFEWQSEGRTKFFQWKLKNERTPTMKTLKIAVKRLHQLLKMYPCDNLKQSKTISGG